MDASRGQGLASGYNSAVERLRETEYPMLKGMPSGKHGIIGMKNGMLTPIQAPSISTMPARLYTPSPWWTTLPLR